MSDSENLERKNRRLWDAETAMSFAEEVLYDELERDPLDLELKALEERFYGVWSDYLSYLDNKPYTARERAEVGWTAGRIGRRVLREIFGSDEPDESV